MNPTDEPLSNRISNQNYLKDQQYKNADNLQARINLHRSFGTNGYPWQKWVFDHLQLRPGLRVLEVGCGPGWLWYENAEWIPENIGLFLGDLSIGMVHAAFLNIEKAGVISQQKAIHLHGCCIDVQYIPYAEASFDLVVANHMLYHAPDIEKAIAELRRVVKMDGKVVTATNGVGHMRQMGEMLEKHVPGYRDGHRTQVRRYALENAPLQLNKYFRKVETHIYQDHLHITDVQPLLEYVASLWDTFDPDHPQTRQKIISQIQDEIDHNGYFLINKSQGILIARP